MAKKKKGARKRAPGTARKTKRTTRASSTATVHRGLRDPRKVNLTYIKKDLRDHIAHLKTMEQTEPVQRTLEILQRTSADLSSPCGATMVIP